MENHEYLLSNVSAGSYVRILSIEANEILKEKMVQKGLLPGVIVYVLRKNNCITKPALYLVENNSVALYKNESEKIIVTSLHK
ncbi:hypothetical protein SH2C18_25330 [Clostridium sediminicola]|uniref:FeoA family protein n=1 Tax=Clostridium sediminicola TaxID=3114879 RepID=UPI0031F1F3CC